MRVVAAEPKRDGKRGGVRAGQRGYARENIVGIKRRRFAKDNQGVAQEEARTRCRFCRCGTQLAFFLVRKQKMLAKL
jgi:hypothetical protein